MTMTISGTDGLTFPDSTAQYSGSYFSFKNRIINGDMRIDQRNAGAAVTGISSGAAYPVDRFQIYNQTSGTYSVQQVSDAPTGFNYSSKITATTAGSTGTAGWTSFFQQTIEGYNIADLGAGTANAKTIILSFWVKSSLTGSMPFIFANNTDRSYATTYTINSANTWEQKTISITLTTSGTWDSTNGRGLRLFWGLGSGSTYTTSTVNSWQNAVDLYFTSGAVAVGATLNATWQVTGVQLEVGSVATPFERRPYGTELALCQRYYEINYYNSNTDTAVSWFLTGTSYPQYMWQFKQQKRATPTFALGTGSWANSTPTAYPTVSEVKFSNGASVSYFYATGTSGAVALTASAEL